MSTDEYKRGFDSGVEASAATIEAQRFMSDFALSHEGAEEKLAAKVRALKFAAPPATAGDVGGPKQEVIEAEIRGRVAQLKRLAVPAETFRIGWGDVQVLLSEIDRLRALVRP